jgi:hypothetical protein
MDDETRAGLKRIDPARDVPPTQPGVARALAERIIMESKKDGSGTTARHPRKRVALAAGLGALAAGALAVVAVVVPGGSADVTRLQAGEEDVSASCAVITPEALREREVAFAGLVTSADGGRAVLEVTHVYKGEVSGVAEVDQGRGAGGSEYSVGEFVEGGSYLISADGGTVSVCGQSGERTRELEVLYDQAFGS